MTSIQVLQLFVLPLEVAGKIRDKVSLWDLPLAGQILGVAMINGIIVPIMIAPFFDLIYSSYLPQEAVQLVAIFLHFLSIGPISRQLRSEYDGSDHKAQVTSREKIYFSS